MTFWHGPRRRILLDEASINELFDFRWAGKATFRGGPVGSETEALVRFADRVLVSPKDTNGYGNGAARVPPTVSRRCRMDRGPRFSLLG
jgi:hypothetical protein